MKIFFIILKDFIKGDLIMANGEYASCPQCGKVAYDRYEIELEFGYRYDGKKPQSWCRECRSAASSSHEGVNKYEAAVIWASHGCDEDYTFGYTEEELEEELRNSL